MYSKVDATKLALLKELCEKAERQRGLTMQRGDISNGTYHFHYGYRTAMRDVIGYLAGADTLLGKLAGVVSQERKEDKP